MRANFILRPLLLMGWLERKKNIIENDWKKEAEKTSCNVDFFYWFLFRFFMKKKDTATDKR